MLATSLPAYADPPTPPPIVAAPLPTITPLVTQQPAPFTGILLSPAAVAKVIADSDAAAANQRNAVKNQAATDAAQLKYQTEQLATTCTADKTDLQAQLTDNKNQVNILTNQLKQNSAPLPGTLWFGLGAGGGILITLLTVFAVSKATK